MEEKYEKLQNEAMEKVGGGMDIDEDVCPKCHSTRFEFTGLIAGGELAHYVCRDCGHSWDTIA